jgi:hypothetical protein
MTDKSHTTEQDTSANDPVDRDAQRALDAASSEPRTLATEERSDPAARMDARATADQTAARRDDPSEDRARS